MGSHARGRSAGRNHHRKALRAGIALACAATLSSTGYALELGDITLSSMLNEPLSASIALESLDGAEAADLSVTLGDEAAYEEAGIERDAVLDDIRFSIEVDSASDGRIILSSTSPVAEPFLNLIVSVSEPDGTSTQKEYTLLLELPTNTAAPQSTTAAPQTAAASAAGNAQSYTVGAGDTLWEVALSTRPDASVSVQQMMLAIQRANPDAFLNGNINNLLNGRVLRIPSQQDIAVIDRDAAVAQVSQQNAGLGGQPLAAGNGGAAARGTDTRDQLRVLSGDAAGAANGGDDLAATIAALENELMLSEENLDRARLENLELNNRLAALQEQIDLLENIIAMEDDRIATLQAELAQQAEATAQALAAAGNAAAQIEELNNEPSAGIAGLLRNGIVALVGLVLVVLAALGFLVYRRRQAQLAAEEGRFNPAFAEIDDAPVADGDAEEKPGLFAGLLARFRRNRDADGDDDDDYEADALVAGSREPVAGAAAYAATQEATSGLRGERDGDDDMISLDAALDGIDNEQAQAHAEVFEPLVDETPDDLAAAEADETEAVAAVDEAQASEADYATTAADAAFAAVDNEVEAAETIEFTMPAAEPEPPEAAASAAAADEDLAETFEFTLKDLPETESPVPAAEAAHEPVETFDFRLSTPAPAAVSEPAAPAVSEAAEPLEVISFPGSASAPAASAVQGDDLPLELGDLSFDDTTLLGDDEEESPYKPRTGNECDTKLDLATAYEAMGDVVEAIEILDEVIAEGSPSQIETAQRLKDSWQASL
ncbi:MAG: FimV/HubP family polar landmark protein [Gammaproteobacteria bacterium]